MRTRSLGSLRPAQALATKQSNNCHSKCFGDFFKGILCVAKVVLDSTDSSVFERGFTHCSELAHRPACFIPKVIHIRPGRFRNFVCINRWTLHVGISNISNSSSRRSRYHGVSMKSTHLFIQILSVHSPRVHVVRNEQSELRRMLFGRRSPSELAEHRSLSRGFARAPTGNVSQQHAAQFALLIAHYVNTWTVNT